MRVICNIMKCHFVTQQSTYLTEIFSIQELARLDITNPAITRLIDAAEISGLQSIIERRLHLVQSCVFIKYYTSPN